MVEWLGMEETENIFDMGFVSLRAFIRYEKDLIIVAGVLIALSSYFIGIEPRNGLTLLISFISLLLASILFFSIYLDYTELRKKVKVTVTLEARAFNVFFEILFVFMLVYMFENYVSGNIALQDLVNTAIWPVLIIVILSILIRIIFSFRRKR